MKAFDKRSATDPLVSLEAPSLRPGRLLRHFGPGLVLMMTGVGTSHLVTAPTAGGRFAFALLWCLPIAYVFKYYGFEMAFRFTGATGRSLLDAYSTSWKKWPLWYILITTLIQCAIGQAGRVIAAAAVLYYLFSDYLGLVVPLWGWGLLLSLLSCAAILYGRYRAIEITTKILAGLLVVSAVVVYLIRPAPLSALGHFFMIETPEGSWLLIAAFLGLLPTGIDVSLQASEWGKASRTGLGGIRSTLEERGLASAFDPFSSKAEDIRIDVTTLPGNVQEYVRRWFKIGIWDFRVGHVISFLMAAIFLLLSAVWLYPSTVEGKAVIGEIAKIFTESVAPWTMTVFLLGAFAATFSTMFNYFDGWPRVVAACCRNLFKRTYDLQGIDKDRLTTTHRRMWYSEYNIYRATMLFSLIAAVLIIAGVEKPVWLVLIASAAAFFIAPVIFAMNLHYCTKFIPRHDKRFYPSAFGRYFGWASFCIFTGFTVLVMLANVFNVSFL
jgi:Mn2+/Fe2+ NRAMP family transporter